MDSMYKDLECPACTKYLLPPIYQCQNGHSLCLKCHSKKENYPLCKASMSETRNFILETLSSNLFTTCTKDCKEVIPIERKEQHEMTCKLEKIVCAYPNCNWVGNLKELPIHWASKGLQGKIYDYKTRNLPINIPKEPLKPTINLYKAHNKFFWFKYQINNEDLIEWSFQLIGNDNKDLDYTFTMEFFNKDRDNKNKKIILADYCLKYEDEEVFKGTEGASIPLSVLNKLIVDNELSCIVYINYMRSVAQKELREKNDNVNLNQSNPRRHNNQGSNFRSKSQQRYNERGQNRPERGQNRPERGQNRPKRGQNRPKRGQQNMAMGENNLLWGMGNQNQSENKPLESQSLNQLMNNRFEVQKQHENKSAQSLNQAIWGQIQSLSQPMAGQSLNKPIATQIQSLSKPMAAQSLNQPIGAQIQPLSKPMTAQSLNQPIGAQIQPLSKPMAAQSLNQPIRPQIQPLSKPMTAQSLNQPIRAQIQPLSRPMAAQSLNQPIRAETQPLSRPMTAQSLNKPMGVPSSAQNLNQPLNRPMNSTRNIQQSRPTGSMEQLQRGPIEFKRQSNRKPKEDCTIL